MKKKIDLITDPIIYPSDKNKKKDNIYFVILDAMIPIKNFEKYYDISLENFIKDVEDLNYQYIHDTNNLYVVGSSIFTTVGYVNPTLSIVQFSLRLSDYIKNKLI